MAELIDKNELLKKAVMISGPSGKTTYSVVFTDDITNTKVIESFTENRLKAEIAERLEKFQKKIEELDLTDVFPDYQRGATDTRGYISNMLQEEIDSLKGENEKA